MKRKAKCELKDVAGGYLLDRVFKDIHEYEIYFEFSNSGKLDNLAPNKIKVKFKVNGVLPELFYPDNERTVELIVPIRLSQNNRQTKQNLSKKYLDEYSDLIPKIRFSIKNQITANNKVIGSSKKVESYLKEAIHKRRNASAKKAKKMASVEL